MNSYTVLMIALHTFCELFGMTLGDGQVLPALVFDQFTDIQDLSDMMGIMGQLTVDDIHDEERFAADMHCLEKVIFF